MFIEIMNKIPKSEINESGIMDLDPFESGKKKDEKKKWVGCC